MRKVKASVQSPAAERRSAPVLTPDARESQLISLAYDAVEKRIRDGTAKSQELVYFLKMGSRRENLEREILANQRDLVVAKTEQIKSQERTDEMYKRALDAMREYSGRDDSDDQDIFDADDDSKF